MARIDFQKNDTYRNAYDGILRLTKHVSSADELPEIGPSNGDIYSVGEDNNLYIYNGSWAPMGSGSSSDGGKFVTIHGNLASRASGEYFAEISEMITAVENGELSGGVVVYGEQGKMSYSAIRDVLYHAASGQDDVEHYTIDDGNNHFIHNMMPTVDALNLAVAVSQRIYDNTGQYVNIEMNGAVLIVILPYDGEDRESYQIWIMTSDGEYDSGLPVKLTDSTGHIILVKVDDNGVVTSVFTGDVVGEGNDTAALTSNEIDGLMGKRLIHSSSEINYED